MKNTHRIVTKSRYGLIRAVLFFLLFTIEYWLILGAGYGTKLISGDWSMELFRFLLSYLGYIALEMFFVCRTNNKKVYLSYESLLGMAIKCILIDLITMCFYGATELYSDFGVFLEKMWFLLLANLLTILVVLILINVVNRMYHQESEKILYITNGSSQTDVQLDQYDSVYLVDLPAQERNDWLKLCYEKDKTVYTTVKLSDILIRTSGFAQDRDQLVFYCTKFGLGGINAFLKRSFDVLFSGFALLLVWPVMLLTAIAIKIEDGGKVLYSQTRCTKDRKEFKIYKFRSMIEDSESETGACLAKTDDERITRVGKIIRNWKIDELPQLFNILKGDMSVVGPRPERPELIEENCKVVPEFCLRTKVKAGLTGYAQIRGEYDTDKLDKLKWDLIYIEHYSFILDLKIIAITAIMLVKRNFRKKQV